VLTRYVGIDAHAASLTIAIAEPDGSVHSWGEIPNTLAAVRKLVHKLRLAGYRLQVCYETGPTGYVLHEWCTALGIPCDVIATGLIPRRATDRIKTNRRDALMLARLYRAGELTPIFIPDAAHLALRDLVRAREDAVDDLNRARHRLSKFLLRHGYTKPEGVTPWSTRHRLWIHRLITTEPRFTTLPTVQAVCLDYLGTVDQLTDRRQRFERTIAAAVEAAPPRLRALVHGLQALRGVALVTAATIASELGTLRRFRKPTALMSYAGVTPSEHSTGDHRRQGGITKCGNAHLRRVLIEAAWHYQYPPRLTLAQRSRTGLTTARGRQVAWAAQQRLCPRFRALVARGKRPTVAVTAVARELLGFIWDIGLDAEASVESPLETSANAGVDRRDA
jgi:transposase